MNETKKSVNTTETQKNEIYTPNFIRFGRFTIKDINSDTFFNCKKDSDIIAALKLYKYYTTKGGYIIGLFQNRLAEYIAKRLYPNVSPYLFDKGCSNYLNLPYVEVKENGKKNIYSTNLKCVESVHLAKTVKITPQGMISYLPFKPKSGVLTDEIAEIVVEFFTDKYTIGWALYKCVNTGDYHIKHINDYIALYKTQNNIKSTETTQKQDLFAENQDKTSNNKNDSLHSVLFEGVDNSDFNALSERCKLIRNIVHLHTCNNAGLERILSETEKVTDNYLLEKDKQEIKSCLDLDDTPPEMIKEILKLVRRNKGSLK